MLGAGLAIPTACSHPADAAGPTRRLPELTHRDRADWINSSPLRTADLRGSVVLLDVWTFGCWSCYRSFPWLRRVESRFADLRVLGVHAPELDHERSRERVRALHIRATFVGETHEGDEQAERIERRIADLLAEPKRD